MSRDDVKHGASNGLQAILNAPRFITHLTDEQRKMIQAAIQRIPSLPDDWVDSVITLADTL